MGATTAPLSIEAFRAWLESRPDEEHWELIGGVITMMAPATRDHQRIGSNLVTMLRSRSQSLSLAQTRARSTNRSGDHEERKPERNQQCSVMQDRVAARVHRRLAAQVRR